MYCVCKEHLELALDLFVDEYEEAPDVYALNELKFTAWEPPAQCERCGEAPEYLVI
ncbi:CxxH/CxxC protein [Paenibacillus koleovorans]|uniref:CxxH/CxxC protein n=1 Tax=Paenibacillus koleovorans TaxID=121608 RepID=UPI000FD99EFD|nr:CxxH/CxxC protein [Paenibacillus koleovorans]